VTSTATDPDLVDDGTGGDDGPPTGLVVGLAITGLLVVGIGITLLIRRRKAT
jgi:hypothetical protein